MIPFYNRQPRMRSPYFTPGLTRYAKYGTAIAGVGVALYNRLVSRKSSKPVSSSVSSRGPKPYIKRVKLRRKANTKVLAKQVHSLQKKVSAGEGELTYKERFTDKLLNSANQCAYGNYAGYSTAMIERALALLKFYDPTTPGTYITSNLTSGTQSKKVEVSAYTNFLCRNNYKTPCIVTVYLCMPKSATDLTASFCVTDGLADVGVSTSTTNILAYPSESNLFNKIWKTIKSKRVVLEPGQEYKMSYKTSPIIYDPAVTDSQTDAYQKQYKSHLYLVRISGPIGHDTVDATQQTTLAAGIDIMTDSILTVNYDAGVNLKYVSLLNNADTSFTTSGVVSQVTITNQAESST